MSPILITYIAAAVLLIICLFLEWKITVLDLFIAGAILAIPFLNVALFLVNLIMILDHRGVIHLRGIGQSIIKFLNVRIK